MRNRLYRFNPLVQNIIVPTRVKLERSNYTPEVAWAAAQAYAWAIKAAFAVFPFALSALLEDWGAPVSGRHLFLSGLYYLTAVGAVGLGCIFAPWLGLDVESIFDILERHEK